MNNLWILARAEAGEATSTVASKPMASDGESTTKTASDDPNIIGGEREQAKPLIPMWLILPLMAVMVIVLFRGPRKKQKEHKKMVQSLEKNDRVRTIGGIIGTVVDIKDDEITLKIDESNNTKIKVAPSAIGKNVTKDKN